MRSSAGNWIDASIVEAPKQRLTAEEKRQIRDGETPSWLQAKQQKRKPGSQAATPDGGTPPNATERTAEALMIPAFGYKNHINIGRRFGFIRRFVVTVAAGHDGQRLADVLNPDAFDSRVWADTAYRSAANERTIEEPPGASR